MRVSKLLNPEKFRYERKFLLTSLMKHHLTIITKNHPRMFSQAYPERFVNNIYFDTLNMSHYWDNVAGITPRIKVRIRWYGELLGEIKKPVLEFKLKNNMLGSKTSFMLDPLTIDRSSSLDIIKERFRKLEISDALKEYLLSLRFSLMNRYRRQYFESLDNRFRVTIDSDLDFFHISPEQNHFLRKIRNPLTTILELKYEEQYDDEASFISNYFPFRMTKSSKYVSGVQQV